MAAIRRVTLASMASSAAIPARSGRSSAGPMRPARGDGVLP